MAVGEIKAPESVEYVDFCHNTESCEDCPLHVKCPFNINSWDRLEKRHGRKAWTWVRPVSYTHLTLPTTERV